MPTIPLSSKITGRTIWPGPEEADFTRGAPLPTIFLDKAKVGMVLARPAVTEQGEVVLPAGAVLAQEVLSRLSRLDLKYISVENTPALTVKKRRTSEVHAEQELEERFSRAQANPLLSRIKEALKSELKSHCKRNASSG